MHNKIKTQKQIEVIAKRLKVQSKKIVFTNGCFDILHRGHVEYLEKAKAAGDVLVVGLNTDKSVKCIKGPDRPVNKEVDRAVVLSGLSAVDYIVLFNEDTPLNLIKAVKPQVLVKGGDWKSEDIVGSDIVKASGGKVISIPFVKGYSTTKLLNKITK